MLVKTEDKAFCQYCQETIILREYEGMEGKWFTDHICSSEKDDTPSTETS